MREGHPGEAPRRPAYTLAERRADAVMHVAGLSGSLIAAPALIGLALWQSADGPTVAAAAIYGLCLVGMFAASAGYHMLDLPRCREVLRRLDHAAIYAKIAGTYTPFTVILGGERAVVILAGMWSAAGAGMALKILAPRRFEILTLGLYLAMGWAIALVGGPILAGLSAASLALIVTGGVLYTVGVVFHLWDGLPFQNAIWHGFVLVASFVFYAAVSIEVLAGSA